MFTVFIVILTCLMPGLAFVFIRRWRQTQLSKDSHQKVQDYITQKLFYTDNLIDRKWREVNEAQKRADEKQITFAGKFRTLEELLKKGRAAEKRLQLEKAEWTKKKESENQGLAEARRQLEEKILNVQEQYHDLKKSRKQIQDEENRLKQAERLFAEKDLKLMNESKRLEKDLKNAQEDSRKLKEERKHLQQQLKLLEEKLNQKAPENHEVEAVNHVPVEVPEKKSNKKNGYQSSPENTPVGSKAKLKEKSPKVEPVKRGGVRIPDKQTNPIDEPGHHGNDTHDRRAEIVCQKKGREWIVGVELPEDISAKPRVQLYQNSVALQQAENGNNFWYLEQANGEVVISWDENGTNIKLGEEPYLIYKLSGQNGNYGRLMRHPSHGSFLLVAPESWRRDETLSGPAFAAPEPVSLQGYQAHFFDIEKHSDIKIALLTQNNEPVVINPKAIEIELVGLKLKDAEEKMGPLFGKEIPIVRALNEQVWKEVSLIIVGEEGLGRGKWRTEMKPILDQQEQELPLELSQTKIGWYFLRFYNKNHELIDSMDFRFIRELHEIKVHPSSPIPLNYEHKLTTVEFLHGYHCEIRPNDPNEQNIELERKDTKTIVTIPADSNYDKTRWLVCPKSKLEVPVTILVERLWWGMSDEDNEPSEWSCKLLRITRNDLTASSSKALWLRLPNRRWAKSVRAGFEHTKTKQFPVKVVEQTIAMPFRDFSDSEELQSTGIKPFHVWLDHQGSEYTLLPSQLEINLKCNYCYFLVENEEDFLDHVKSKHLDELTRPLTYEEMRKYFPKLPSKIYKCAYGPFYAESGDPNNPTSTIIDHIQNDCKEVPRGDGPVHISFFPIDDVEEIKQNVQNKFIQKLQLYYKCTLCDDDLKNASKTLRMEHLKNIHLKSLWDLH